MVTSFQPELLTVWKQTAGAIIIQQAKDSQLHKQLVSEPVLEQAFTWLCRQRRHWISKLG